MRIITCIMTEGSEVLAEDFAQWYYFVKPILLSFFRKQRTLALADFNLMIYPIALDERRQNLLSLERRKEGLRSGGRQGLWLEDRAKTTGVVARRRR